jgi:hypothetical protein
VALNHLTVPTKRSSDIFLSPAKDFLHISCHAEAQPNVRAKDYHG